MAKLRRKMDNEESRKFWESFPKRKDDDDRRVLPSLGDIWWEEDSPVDVARAFGLLDKDEEEVYKVLPPMDPW